MDMSLINPLVWLDWVKRDRSENTCCHKTACGLCNNLLYCSLWSVYAAGPDNRLWHSR